MDAFFVSVEELSDPSLKGKAVVVGGQRDQRGVVSAASYEARKFGVHSALPLRTAAKLCPHAIFLDGHPDLYREYSQKARQVLQSFSPAVEMASIDEAYLDMTGTEKLHGPPLRSAQKLHQQMKECTGLNCSVGIGSSRLMAKICSDQAKPNGVLYVLPGQEQSFLAPLDVGKIPGVGKVTKTRLNEIGIIHIGDLLRVQETVLHENFGKWGAALAGKARGEDAGAWFEGEVGEEWQAKSISHEHTFDQDTADREKLESTLARLSEMVGRRLREFFPLPVSCSTRIGKTDAPFDCWACRLPILMTCPNKWICWKAVTGKNGRGRSPRQTGCATNMGIQQSFWPRAWEALSGNEFMKTRRKSRKRRNNQVPNQKAKVIQSPPPPLSAENKHQIRRVNSAIFILVAKEP